MNHKLHFLESLLITIWVGGLWTVGYLAIPTLFYAQDNRVLAGLLAGKMLSKIAWLGLICGCTLLALLWFRLRAECIKSKLFWVTSFMLLLTLCLQFGLQPAIAEIKTHPLNIEPYATQFKALHGIYLPRFQFAPRKLNAGEIMGTFTMKKTN